MNGSVIFSKPPLAASDANATSSTTTRPLRSRARGSLRGEAKASSAWRARGSGVARTHGVPSAACTSMPMYAPARCAVTPDVRRARPRPRRRAGPPHGRGPHVRLRQRARPFAATLETGRATFWSRSRGELWEKGRTSGNEIAGRSACSSTATPTASSTRASRTGHLPHRARRAASSRCSRARTASSTHARASRPQTLLATLEAVLEARKASTGEASYTKSLYEAGAAAIGAKLARGGGRARARDRGRERRARRQRGGRRPLPPDGRPPLAGHPAPPRPRGAGAPPRHERPRREGVAQRRSREREVSAKIAFFGLPLAAVLLASDGHDDRVRGARPRAPGCGALARASRAAGRACSRTSTRKAAVARVRAARAGAGRELVLDDAACRAACSRSRRRSACTRRCCRATAGPTRTSGPSTAATQTTGVTAHLLDGRVRHRGPSSAQRELRIDPEWDAWKLAQALDRPSLALAARGGGRVRRRAPSRRRCRRTRRRDAAPRARATTTWRSSGRGRRRASSGACARRRPGPGRGRRSATRSSCSCACAPRRDFPRALEPGEAAVRADGVAVVRAGDGAVELLEGATDDDDAAPASCGVVRLASHRAREAGRAFVIARECAYGYPIRVPPRQEHRNANGRPGEHRVRPRHACAHRARIARAWAQCAPGRSERAAAAARARGAHRAGDGRAPPDRAHRRGAAEPHAPTALAHVQAALAALQAQPPRSTPRSPRRMEAVAGALGSVHSLARAAAAQAGAAPAAPRRRRRRGLSRSPGVRPAARVRAPHRPPPAAGYAPPQPRRSAQLAAAAARAPAAARPAAPPQRPAPQAAAPAAAVPGTRGGGSTVAAELGAHSPSNFYKGLSGNDIVDHGGLFVSTYKLPQARIARAPEGVAARRLRVRGQRRRALAPRAERQAGATRRPASARSSPRSRPRRASWSTATCATASRCSTTTSRRLRKERRGTRTGWARAGYTGAACRVASALLVALFARHRSSRCSRWRRGARARNDPKLLWKTIETTALPHQLLLDRGRGRAARRDARRGIYARLVPAVGWPPSETQTEIVLTDQTDSANGSATALPYDAITLYVTAPDDMSPLGDVDDWYLELVTHEYTHILHTDHIAGHPGARSTDPRQDVRAEPGAAALAPRGARRLRGERARRAAGACARRCGTCGCAPTCSRTTSRRSTSSRTSPRRWPQGNIWYLYGSFFMQWIAETYGEQAIRAMIDDYAWQVIPYAINRSIRRATGQHVRGALPRVGRHDEARASARRPTPSARAALREGDPAHAHGQHAASTRAGSRRTRGPSTRATSLFFADDGHTTPGLWALPLVRDAQGRVIGGARGRARAHRSARTASRRASFMPDGDGGLQLERHPRQPLLLRRPLRAAGRTRRARRASTGERVRWTRRLARARSRASRPTAGASSSPPTTAARRYLQIADVVPSPTADGHELANVRALVPSGALRSGVHAALVARQPARRLQRVAARRLPRRAHRRHVGRHRSSTSRTTAPSTASPSFSPDGRWLYFHSDRTGIMNVYAYELATGRAEAGHERGQRRVPAGALARRQDARVRRLHARGLRPLRDAARRVAVARRAALRRDAPGAARRAAAVAT